MEASPKWSMILFIISAVVADSTAKSALRVFGGRDARPGEYPYVVALETHHNGSDGDKLKLIRRSHCTGAAISSTWTLTAAHCFTILNPTGNITILKNKKVVSYGSPHKKLIENNLFSTILRTVRPPLSQTSFDRNFDDIGLIQSEAMAMNTFGKISSIDITSLYGYEVTLLGYGTMADSTTKIVDVPLNLNKSLQIIDKAVMLRCHETSKLHPAVLLKYLHCAAYRCGPIQKLYIGDSGGPAVHASGIVGVNVAGLDISRMRQFEGLTRIVRDIAAVTAVSDHLDWIHSYVSS